MSFLFNLPVCCCMSVEASSALRLQPMPEKHVTFVVVPTSSRIHIAALLSAAARLMVPNCLQAKPTSSHLAPLAALHVLGGMAVRRSGDSPILLAPRSCRTPAGFAIYLSQALHTMQCETSSLSWSSSIVGDISGMCAFACLNMFWLRVSKHVNSILGAARRSCRCCTVHVCLQELNPHPRWLGEPQALKWVRSVFNPPPTCPLALDHDLSHREL